MKRFCFLICFLFSLSCSLFANEALFDSANKAYIAEDYEKAVPIYEDILKNGEESVALYYNLGNTYYKLGRVAPSILNFERALLLDPSNEDVLYNLEMAKAKTVDKIDSIDKFFLLRIVESISDWFVSNTWAYASIVMFVLFLVAIALYFFSRSVILKKISFFSSILFILFTFVTMYNASVSKDKFTKHSYAIIFSPSVSVKSSPDDSGKDIFLLHEGTKVKVKNDYNGWFEIKLEDGTTGWVQKSAAERI